ncbi:unnamed protein product [Amoebophrya sp. A120]|nr:unnamed protein product [Amoebophrya sp. A120]|eukprot:GSA120T00005122001.1
METRSNLYGDLLELQQQQSENTPGVSFFGPNATNKTSSNFRSRPSAKMKQSAVPVQVASGYTFQPQENLGQLQGGRATSSRVGQLAAGGTVDEEHQSAPVGGPSAKIEDSVALDSFGYRAYEQRQLTKKRQKEQALVSVKLQHDDFEEFVATKQKEQAQAQALKQAEAAAAQGPQVKTMKSARAVSTRGFPSQRPPTTFTMPSTHRSTRTRGRMVRQRTGKAPCCLRAPFAPWPLLIPDVDADNEGVTSGDENGRATTSRKTTFGQSRTTGCILHRVYCQWIPFTFALLIVVATITCLIVAVNFEDGGLSTKKLKNGTIITRDWPFYQYAVSHYLDDGFNVAIPTFFCSSVLMFFFMVARHPVADCCLHRSASAKRRQTYTETVALLNAEMNDEHIFNVDPRRGSFAADLLPTPPGGNKMGKCAIHCAACCANFSCTNLVFVIFGAISVVGVAGVALFTNGVSRRETAKKYLLRLPQLHLTFATVFFISIAIYQTLHTIFLILDLFQTCYCCKAVCPRGCCDDYESDDESDSEDADGILEMMAQQAASTRGERISRQLDAVVGSKGYNRVERAAMVPRNFCTITVAIVCLCLNVLTITHYLIWNSNGSGAKKEFNYHEWLAVFYIFLYFIAVGILTLQHGKRTEAVSCRSNCCRADRDRV